MFTFLEITQSYTVCLVDSEVFASLSLLQLKYFIFILQSGLMQAVMVVIIVKPESIPDLRKVN